MRAARAVRAAALLACLLAAGCLGGPRLTLVEADQQSGATYEGDRYLVHLRGRVLNDADEQARRVVLRAGVGDDCLGEPPLPAYVDVGNLAPRTSHNVREDFEHARPPAPRPVLWWKLFLGEGGAQVAKGCAALPVG